MKTHFKSTFFMYFRTLTSYLNTDYGKDKEYAVLRDNCYEYTDREYTYKLCPFSTASQRPKSGGHETNLGYVHMFSWPVIMLLIS